MTAGSRRDSILKATLSQSSISLLAGSDECGYDFVVKKRLGSTDDCGFSPFSVDVKPKHGSPDIARDIAFQKIAERVKGTRMASERLGLLS